MPRILSPQTQRKHAIPRLAYEWMFIAALATGSYIWKAKQMAMETWVGYIKSDVSLIMEHYSAAERKGKLMLVGWWRNFKNMVNVKNNITNCMIPLICSVTKRQVYKYRQQICGWPRLRLQTGTSYCGLRIKAVSVQKCCERNSSDGCTNLLKHLRW